MGRLPNSGITISAVRTELPNESTNDLGRLCTSNWVTNRTQWSFYKPVVSPKLSLTQPQDWYAVNDGFDIRTYNNAFDLLDDFIAGMDSHCWVYQPPTGGSASPYRLGDFRGYYNHTDKWFKFEFDNTDTAYVGETRRLVNNSLNPAVALDEMVNNFPAFSAVSPSLHPQGAAHYGFLMIAANSSGNLPQSFNSCYFYPICNVLDYDDRLNFKVPSGINSGKYFFVPVILSYYSSTPQYAIPLKRDDPTFGVYGTWYPIPSNIFSLTVSNTPYTPTLDFTTEINTMTVSFNYNNNDEISDLEGDVSFRFSSAQSWLDDGVEVGSIQIQYTNSPSRPYMNVANSTLVRPQPPTYLTTNEQHFNYKDSFVALKDNWKEENEMPFRVTYTVYKNGGISQTFTEEFKATVLEINGNPV